MVTIPLTPLSLQDNGFHLLVGIEVFGQTRQAVLDTGASKTVFDKTSIEKILDEGTELEYSEYLSTGLGTTSMESFTVQLPSLRIGDWQVKKQRIAVLDLSTINYAYEQMKIDPVIGVVGSDILMEYGGVIDYAKMTLRLRQRRRSRKQRME